MHVAGNITEVDAWSGEDNWRFIMFVSLCRSTRKNKLGELSAQILDRKHPHGVWGDGHRVLIPSECRYLYCDMV